MNETTKKRECIIRLPVFSFTRLFALRNYEFTRLRKSGNTSFVFRFSRLLVSSPYETTNLRNYERAGIYHSSFGFLVYSYFRLFVFSPLRILAFSFFVYSYSRLFVSSFFVYSYSRLFVFSSSLMPAATVHGNRRTARVAQAVLRGCPRRCLLRPSPAPSSHAGRPPYGARRRSGCNPGP